MPELDFESDQFLALLSDALRAGPGSPEWHDAVSRVRERSGEEVDEYQLLIRARQDLESGKEYRFVRAGPGFTSRLMQSIDQGGGAQRHHAPITTWIAFVSGGVLLGA